MKHFADKKGRLLLTLALCLFAANSWAGAGKVLFVSGNVKAVDNKGLSRPLHQGDEVNEGDALVTTSGQVQIRFRDGGLVALMPDSTLRIEQYRYRGLPDGRESSVLILERGGMRSVTGLIGKEDPEAYRLGTPLTTTAIEGESYKARLCSEACQADEQGLYITTTSGSLRLSNDAGAVTLAAGQTVYVTASDVAPRLVGSNIPFFAESRLTGPPPKEFMAGEELDAKGAPAALDLN